MALSFSLIQYCPHLVTFAIDNTFSQTDKRFSISDNIIIYIIYNLVSTQIVEMAKYWLLNNHIIRNLGDSEVAPFLPSPPDNVSVEVAARSGGCEVGCWPTTAEVIWFANDEWFSTSLYQEMCSFTTGASSQCCQCQWRLHWGLNWFIIKWKFKTVNRTQNRINNSSVHIKTGAFSDE